VNIAGVDISIFDLLMLLALFAAFIIGFMQGTIRRLLGIISIVFSFFLAANVKEPLGKFLAENWDQFPKQYSEMIGFFTVFIAGVIASTIVIQGTYKKTQLFEKYQFVDEIIGGFLGVFQVVMFLTFVTLILDTFFFLGLPRDPEEIHHFRNFWEPLNASATGQILHTTIIPRFVDIFGILLPDSVEGIYRG
jgi:membrane protein required for colicin V production